MITSASASITRIACSLASVNSSFMLSTVVAVRGLLGHRRHGHRHADPVWM
jgi:hypothetical protein